MLVRARDRTTDMPLSPPGSAAKRGLEQLRPRVRGICTRNPVVRSTIILGASGFGTGANNTIK